jgi:hypothetical protein
MPDKRISDKALTWIGAEMSKRGSVLDAKRLQVAFNTQSPVERLLLLSIAECEPFTGTISLRWCRVLRLLAFQQRHMLARLGNNGGLGLVTKYSNEPKQLNEGEFLLVPATE